MTVRLLLQDGTVKEYPFKDKDPAHRMKCGASECDHVECVMEEWKAIRLSMKTTLATLPVGTVITLGFMLYFLRDVVPSGVKSSAMLYPLAGIVLILGMEIVFLVVLYRHARDTDTSVKELQEFSQRKTVNGIPAEQIRETSTGTSVRETLPPRSR